MLSGVPGTVSGDVSNGGGNVQWSVVIRIVDIYKVFVIVLTCYVHVRHMTRQS
jgi:hypothetical protein